MHITELMGRWMGGEMRGGWVDGWVNEQMAEITKHLLGILAFISTHMY